MRASVLRVAVLGSAMCVTTASTAHGAEERSSPIDPKIAARRDVSFDLRPGVFLDTDHGDAGAFIGADVFHRRGLLVVGGVGELAASPFGAYRYSAAAAAAGISAPTPQWIRIDWQWIRIDWLGTFGAHAYTGVGTSWANNFFLVQDPPGGSSALLPTVGTRLRTTFEIGKPRARFSIGLAGILETDTTHVTRPYQSRPLFGLPEVQRTRTLGTDRYAIALSFGGTFGL